MRRALLLSGIALATLGATASFAAVAAHHGHRGKFSCEAVGANIGGHTFAVANKKYTPCFNKLGRINKAGRTLKLTKIGAVTASTRLKGKRKQPRNGTSALASARTAKVTTGLLGKKGLTIGVAQSSVKETCVAKGHKLSLHQTSKSFVAYIELGGKRTNVGNKSMKISLGPLGTIYLNRTLRSGHTLMRRAVEIDLLGTKPTIILAQTQAGYTSNPCK